MTLSDLVSFCEERDLRGWARAHLVPEIHRRRIASDSDEERKRLDRTALHHCPTDDDLLGELDRMYEEPHRRGLLWHWCEQFARRGDPEMRCASIVLRWLARDPSPEPFCFAAKAILQIGTRPDLEGLRTQQPAEAAAAAAFADASLAVKQRSLS